MIFSLLKSRKRDLLLAGDDVASRPSGELTWRAGPARGWDVALRPRGRATPGPREAQVALRGGRRPRERVHADAHEGRHVACGFAYGGPTGTVGPW